MPQWFYAEKDSVSVSAWSFGEQEYAGEIKGPFRQGEKRPGLAPNQKRLKTSK